MERNCHRIKNELIKNAITTIFKAELKIETVQNMNKNTKKNAFLNIFDASIRQQSGQIVKRGYLIVHMMPTIEHLQDLCMKN